MTTEIALILSGIGGSILLAFRGVALWRGGTDARQRNLMADMERGRRRAEHNDEQREIRYRAAVQHIDRIAREHRHCDVEVPPFVPPKWKPFSE